MAVEALEYQVLSILRSRLQFYKFNHLLREELFESRQTKKVYKILRAFHVKYESRIITTKNLGMMLNSHIKPEEKSQYRGIISRIKKNIVRDEAVMEVLIKRFAKRQILKQAILEGVALLDSGEEPDFEKIRQRVDEATMVEADKINESYDYFHSPDKRVEEEGNEERIATRISSDLDSALGGGLAAGELGLFVGPTGTGKTLALCNVAYSAMAQGKKVVYATLEISPRKVARRIDCRISGASYGDIRKDPGLVSRKLKTLRVTGAGLHIKDYTSSLCSTAELRAYLERLRENGFKFGMVIVDYLDLMYATRKYSEKRFELSSIASGLRRIASEFKVPVWSASQGTRKAGALGTTKLWDIAEDIGKANTADAAITISQTEVEKEDGMARLHVRKTRMSEMNPQVTVLINYQTMTMKGVKRDPLEKARKK